MQVIFSKIELEISPFLTVIQFYSNIVEKRVGKSPQGISTRPTFRNILTNLKEQDKTKMELPLDMVSISASICRTIRGLYTAHNFLKTKFLWLSPFNNSTLSG